MLKFACHTACNTLMDVGVFALMSASTLSTSCAPAVRPTHMDICSWYIGDSELSLVKQLTVTTVQATAIHLHGYYSCCL